MKSRLWALGVLTAALAGAAPALAAPATVNLRVEGSVSTIYDAPVTTDGPHLVATLRDLGSTNGTFLDSQRIGAAELGIGSSITIGRTRAVYRSGER